METRVTERDKPPYLLGLLCLIPFIGAFVGLGLLLYSLGRYKDKKLTLIGVFGILFTVVFYWALFYVGKRLSPGKGFEKISQHNLNQLAKDIEFYKMEYEYYPETLEQLRTTDSFIVIYDPLQAGFGKEATNYSYKKIGEHYTLFSVGIDGKPNTNDDLYPKIRVNDSTKIGFIRKQ